MVLHQAAQRASRLLAKLHLKLNPSQDGVALLDYDRRPIQLGVSSEIEYHTRLHSCKKEPETIAWIENEFVSQDVFYDIGANVGAYTLVAAAYWGGAVQVVAIEPSAVNFSRLVRNLVLNRCEQQVIPLSVALGRRTGLKPFHYENLVSGGSLHALGEARNYRGQEFVPAATCPALSFDLDTLVEQFSLPHPTHLKLDVDGTELEILEGAQKMLKGVRSVLVELDKDHPQTPLVRSFLQEHGFKEASSYPYRYGETHPEFRGVANVLFRKSDGK